MVRLTKLKFLAVAVAVALAPVLFWLPIDSWSFRFGSVYAAARTFGQIAGIVGLTLLAGNIILSARLPVFDRWVGGLDKIYLHHRSLGVVAFFLVLAHPLLLAAHHLAYSPLAAWRFLMPWSSQVGAGAGFASLGLLVVLVSLTFWKPLHYHLWKWSHKLMGVVLALGVAHFLAVSGNSVRGLWLRVFLLALASLAAVTWVHRAALGGRFAKRWRYRLASVREAVRGVWEIHLKPVGPAMPFRAGQFVFLRFPDSSLGGEEHVFTVASSPSDEGLWFVIKNSGDWTARLGELEPGAAATLEGPFGGFDPTACRNAQVWIAGGIGVTPFLSVVRSAARRGAMPDVAMFYCVEERGRAVYADGLADLAARWGWLRLEIVASRDVGRLTLEKLAASVPDWRGRDYFLCGPEAMMMSWKKLLRNRGVDGNHIHFERFALKK